MSQGRVGDDPQSLSLFRLAVALLPVIVLLRQDNTLFAVPHNIDSWLYLGYFRNLAEYKVVYRATYYGSRLSWIIPGWAAHTWLGPLAASYVLHLAVHLTGTLSLFEILRRHIANRAAFLAAFVFSVSPQLNAATGSDYVDGAGIAYCLLGMALLAGSADRRPPGAALFFGGAALAACAYTNLFWIALMPAVAICCATLDPDKRSWLRTLLWAVPGAAVLTGILCAVNYRLDGLWWFYEPSTRAARELLGVKNFWFRGLFGEYGLEPWLWIPAAALGLAFLELIRRAGRLRTGFALAYIAAVAAMCFFQFVRRQPVLGLSFYADYLLPFAFLLIGVSLWGAAEAMSGRQIIALFVGAALVFASVWADWQGAFTPIWPKYHVPIAVCGAALIAAAWALCRRGFAPVLALAAFALFTSELRFASGMWPEGSDPNPLPYGPHEYRLTFERVVSISDQLDRLRAGKRVYFWYDENELARSEYWALNAIYMFVLHRISPSFPTGACAMPVEPNSLVVIATERPSLLPQARQQLLACWAGKGIRPVEALPDTQVGGATLYTVSVLRAATAVP
jgi:hypothetical protein